MVQSLINNKYMKKLTFLVTMLTIFVGNVSAQYKKDGTPDMRYNSNKQIYGNTYYSSGYSNQSNQSVRYQNGYIKDNGTYVDPHYKTGNNSTNWDNFSTKQNSNPYTGESGSRVRDYSNDAYNYGSGQQIQTGPKGGQYYINSNGNKVYVPKRGGEW